MEEVHLIIFPFFSITPWSHDLRTSPFRAIPITLWYQLSSVTSVPEKVTRIRSLGTNQASTRHKEPMPSSWHYKEYWVAYAKNILFVAAVRRRKLDEMILALVTVSANQKASIISFKIRQLFTHSEASMLKEKNQQRRNFPKRHVLFQ